MVLRLKTWESRSLPGLLKTKDIKESPADNETIHRRGAFLRLKYPKYPNISKQNDQARERAKAQATRMRSRASMGAPDDSDERKGLVLLEAGGCRRWLRVCSVSGRWGHGGTPRVRSVAVTQVSGPKMLSTV